MIFIYSKLEVIFSCTDRDLDEPSQSRNQVIPRRVISPLNLSWDQKKKREEYLSLKGETNLNINRFIIPRNMLTSIDVNEVPVVIFMHVCSSENSAWLRQV